jgi:hypothetical protein
LNGNAGKEETMGVNARAMRIIGMLPRAALIMLALAMPVIGVSAVKADNSTTIEAPTMQKGGVGLVLLVSLQRG